MLQLELQNSGLAFFNLAYRIFLPIRQLVENTSIQHPIYPTMAGFFLQDLRNYLGRHG
jgi:hypothetical protein